MNFDASCSYICYIVLINDYLISKYNESSIVDVTIVFIMDNLFAVAFNNNFIIKIIFFINFICLDVCIVLIISYGVNNSNK